MNELNSRLGIGEEGVINLWDKETEIFQSVEEREKYS